MTNYLPQHSTIDQACDWLSEKTEQQWILSRLLECHLTPHFWVDYKPGYPQIFGNRIEGYLTKMMFQGDFVRLEADGTDALVNMYAAHDGSLIKIEPGWRVPLSELRFKREAIERVAEIINKEKATHASTQAVPVEGSPVVEAPAGQPSSLTTSEIAHAFDGLKWNEAGWKKGLGNKPKWLAACVAIPAKRGVSETRWSPVFIGAALVSIKKFSAKSVRAKFQTNHLLKPWLDAWKSHEAEYLTTE